MTLRTRYNALLADLLREREEFGKRWESYYDGKIAQLEAAIAERFGGGVNGDKTEAVLAHETLPPTDGA